MIYKISLDKHPTVVIDNSEKFTGKYRRVSYKLELRSEKYGRQVVVSEFDMFTDDVKDLGLPTKQFDKKVTNLSVMTNKGMMMVGPTSGSMVFSPNSYAPKVVGKPELSSDGDFGCMGVYVGKKVLWSINGLTNGACSIGIGPNKSGTFEDWTFEANSDMYTEKTLYVLLR